MADNTSSVEEHEVELDRAIQQFIRHARQSVWIAAGMAHATRHGSYTQALERVGGNATITFYPDRVDWCFTSIALADKHVVTIHGNTHVGTAP